jgi:hypothetical protein
MRNFAIWLSAAAMMFSASQALATADAGPASCTQFKAPTISGCRSINVTAFSKTFLDLYRIDAGKAVLDHSMKKEEICVPFDATDCKVAGYYMIETPDGKRLLFRSADLKQQLDSCTCDRNAQQTVAGAPGAGRPKMCPPEMCR